MTSHKGHDHPNTPAARAACRRAMIKDREAPFRAQGVNDSNGRVLEFSPAVGIPTFTRTDQDHCENCGTLDIEALTTGDQGYTACCNELVCSGRATSVWAWIDESTGSTGNIESCCSARITLPHDMMRITHRM